MFTVLFASVSTIGTFCAYSTCLRGLWRRLSCLRRVLHLQLPGMSLHRHHGSFCLFQHCLTCSECLPSFSTPLPGHSTCSLCFQACSCHLHANACLQDRVCAHSHTDVIPIPGPGIPISNCLHYNHHDPLRWQQPPTTTTTNDGDGDDHNANPDHLGHY